ncbi:MAG: hypothetical protein ACNA8W_19805 [Bradymonadaceae bacterium]
MTSSSDGYDFGEPIRFDGAPTTPPSHYDAFFSSALYDGDYVRWYFENSDTTGPGGRGEEESTPEYKVSSHVAAAPMGSGLAGECR